jgi:hypothetical protein
MKRLEQSRCREWSRGWRLLVATVVVLAMAACGGGGGGGGGTGFVSDEVPVNLGQPGPGDEGNHFPLAVGNSWNFQGLIETPGASPVSFLNAVTITGTRQVDGVTAFVFIESNPELEGGSEEFFLVKDLNGIANFGSSLPADPLTSQLFPYWEFRFPLQVGASFVQLDRKGLDFGEDLDEDGINEKFDFRSEVMVLGFETVTVPVGTFEGCAKLERKATFTVVFSQGGSLPFTEEAEAWFAQNVGWVKRSSVFTLDALSERVTEELTGYIVDGVGHGLGSPTILPVDLSPGDGFVPVPIGRPVVASDGTNSLVMARKATGTSPAWLAHWVGVLVGPDGEVLHTFDATAPASIHDFEIGERASLAFDGVNYLFIYEHDNNFASSGLGPSLKGVRMSPEGQLLGSIVDVSLPGTRSPALAFDGTSYLLVYRNTDPMTGLEQIYGVFISPATGQVVGPGAFPITSAPGYQAEPAVAFDGTNYLVVWDQAEWDNQSPGVHAARVTPDGSVLDSDSFPVSNQTGIPAVAFDGTNYLVAYQRSPDNLNFQLFATRISKEGQLLDGSPATGGFPISAGASGSAVSVTLTFANSEYWAAWVASPAIGVYDGIFGARIGADGMVKSSGSSGMRLSPKGFSFFPAITANPSAGLLVWLNQPGANVPNEAGALPIYPFGP